MTKGYAREILTSIHVFACRNLTKIIINEIILDNYFQHTQLECCMNINRLMAVVQYVGYNRSLMRK